MSQAVIQELSLLVGSGWRVVAFESFEEDRALRLLEHVATACERKLHIWSVATGLVGKNESAGSLESGVQAMQQIEEPALFVLLDAHHEMRDSRTVRLLRDWIPRLGKRRQAVILLGPVIDLPLDLSREAGRVALPLPRAEELDKLFRRVIDPGDDPEQKRALDVCVRAALGLTAAESVRVLRKACSQSGGLTQETAHAIVAEKRQALRRTPSLSFHTSGECLSDVGGLDELKRWLGERRRAFGRKARQFGLPLPRGLLLLGVQGCGKSLCAKAVAREWQFPLLRLDLATVFSGATSPEEAIREATAVAESIAPVVLWIDEIEKGFAATGGDTNSSRVFGSFLTWLAEKTAPVFVVATANDVGALPPELLRRGRFDELFFVDLPTQAEREEILAIHLRKHDRDPTHFGLESLAAEAERLSGAELEQVIGAALYSAFAEDRDLTDNDIGNAINETVPLYDTYEDRIKELRNWARDRARLASIDVRMADLFQR